MRGYHTPSSLGRRSFPLAQAFVHSLMHAASWEWLQLNWSSSLSVHKAKKLRQKPPFNGPGCCQSTAGSFWIAVRGGSGMGSSFIRVQVTANKNTKMKQDMYAGLQCLFWTSLVSAYKIKPSKVDSSESGMYTSVGSFFTGWNMLKLGRHWSLKVCSSYPCCPWKPGFSRCLK